MSEYPYYQIAVLETELAQANARIAELEGANGEMQANCLECQEIHKNNVNEIRSRKDYWENLSRDYKKIVSREQARNAPIKTERDALKRELDAAEEHCKHWMNTIDKALGQPRDLVEGSLIDDCVAKIQLMIKEQNESDEHISVLEARELDNNFLRGQYDGLLVSIKELEADKNELGIALDKAMMLANCVDY